MECFVTIVNGFQPWTIITKHSILYVAAAIDPPLGRNLKVLFLKLVDMDTEEPPRMKLNKEDLVSITLDYQAKFNNILDDLKKDISDLKIIYLG